MAYTEVHETGYGQRLGNAFGGIKWGIFLLIAGTILLWWNESNTVKNADAIEEGAGTAIHVDNIDKADPSLEGQLIHASAEAKTADNLNDEEFGFSVNAIKLVRDVEYFQYEEHSDTKTEEKVGGKKVSTTTYTYSTSWCNDPVDSHDFKDAQYQNSNSVLIKFDDKDYTASNVSFGAYKLSPSLISSISGSVDSEVTIDEQKLKAWNYDLAARKGELQTVAIPTATSAPDSTGSTTITTELVKDTRFDYVHVAGNTVYFGKNPDSPQVGDVRVTFKQVNPGMISIISQVKGNSFEAFKASNGKTIEQCVKGKVSMESMFKAQEESNDMWKWIWRVLGVILVISAFKSMFGFISALLNFFPLIAHLVGSVTGFICTLLGLVWALLVIAIAWIAARPMLGLSILAVVVALIGFIIWKGKQAKANAPAEPAQPQPQPVQPQGPQQPMQPMPMQPQGPQPMQQRPMQPQQPMQQRPPQQPMQQGLQQPMQQRPMQPQQPMQPRPMQPQQPMQQGPQQPMQPQAPQQGPQQPMPQQPQTPQQPQAPQTPQA